jgi:hypothetical protein
LLGGLSLREVSLFARGAKPKSEGFHVRDCINTLAKAQYLGILGRMDNPADPPAPPANGSEDQKKQLLRNVHTLLQELIGFTQDIDTPTLLLAAESLIAFRAAKDTMSLQELMNNLLSNMPQMYAIALEAQEEQEPLVVLKA